ncbi:MAG: chromate efflux transporter [Caulobacteraceae bacterium]
MDPPEPANAASNGEARSAPPRHGPWEVFTVALGQGLTSFGGPIAHIGYFERAYVQRRRWLSAEEYAGLVGLCQMIPGPASSQVGFLVGLRRAGWGGAFAAWLGFTLPSALLMFGFAWLSPGLTGPVTQAALHGLKLVAVAVVAQAVWSMGRKLCPDLPRTALAIAAACILLLFAGAVTQLLALAAGAVGGIILCRNIDDRSTPPRLPISRRMGLGALAVFITLLVALPLAASAAPRSLLAMAAVFYKAGALVFGGGHVVLPLLREALVPSGWLADTTFLSGYGAAQAMPGPLFTFAAYLGAVIAPHGSGVGLTALWSLVALGFVFLPGVLVALAGLPLWTWLGVHSTARGALAGVNAAVVGMLGAALYNPIWTTSIAGGRDVAIAAVGLLLLERWRVPPILVVIFCVAASALSSLAP